uniref:FAD-dependent oxidoreductase n=1 Tax=Agathobacter sp. TaxID=2021311 RepID=UPI0040570FC4
MHSVWLETAALPKFEQLKKDRKADVLIIGGGMAGLLCAYQLKQKGVDVCLVEANEICSGITKNTTAKITSQHGLLYYKMLRKLGEERTRMYLEANRQALEEYRKLSKSIDCDFSEADSYVYSVCNRQICEREADALGRLGVKAEFVEQTELPFAVAGAVRFPKQAQFHPLKLLAELTKDLTIYEHTKVRDLLEHIAITDYGCISADKIIVTTHFPFLNTHGSYFLKMYQHRSYVIAYENADKVKGMYVDEAQKGMSFRTYKDLLLIGGGDHRTGKKGGKWAELEAFAKKHYPDAKECYRWATQDCMTLDKIPYIGNYSAKTPNLYVATGFNKWGMTSSMAAAQILTDMVLGKEHPHAKVFNPSRSMLRPQLALNMAESMIHLLTPTKKRCPHMGCVLKWNKEEHSWDCPCHGSRFTKEGNLIDNPAAGDIGSGK